MTEVLIWPDGFAGITCSFLFEYILIIIYTQIKSNTKRTIYPVKSMVSAYNTPWVICTKYVLSNYFTTLGIIIGFETR